MIVFLLRLTVATLSIEPLEYKITFVLENTWCKDVFSIHVLKAATTDMTSTLTI